MPLICAWMNRNTHFSVCVISTSCCPIKKYRARILIVFKINVVLTHSIKSMKYVAIKKTNLLITHGNHQTNCTNSFEIGHSGFDDRNRGSKLVKEETSDSYDVLNSRSPDQLHCNRSEHDTLASWLYFDNNVSIHCVKQILIDHVYRN